MYKDLSVIPSFDIHGVVPPIRPGELGHSLDRAPYPSDMLSFCMHFGGTAPRREILRGLLELRAALRAAGIVEGFQWFNGSFAEDVERLRGRPPGDIDVVTFCAFGDPSRQRQLMRDIPEAFDSVRAKRAYRVDHYFVQADAPNDPVLAELTRWAAYWYSMWAHQRETHQWKGFVSVALGSNDEEAAAWIEEQVDAEEGGDQ